MKKMTNVQIVELNGLLTDHGETLTAFYDEGIQIGQKQGFIEGVVFSLGITIGAGIVYKLSKIRRFKKKTEKES